MKREFTILLSASVPSEKRSEQYRKIRNAQVQIEQAVVGLSRNVFEKRGRLIFGGHPSISPLVTMVASEYEIDREAEPIIRTDPQDKPVTIYQSKAYEEVMPNETSALFNLGYAKIIWIDAVKGEKCDPEINGDPQCEKSLQLMREEMIGQHIDALVCIGGMEGVVKEFDLFRKMHPDKPIYLFESAGGASGNLAREYSNSDNVKVVERIINNYPAHRHREEEREKEKIEIIPFTFLTAQIVDDITVSNRRRRKFDF